MQAVVCTVQTRRTAQTGHTYLRVSERMNSHRVLIQTLQTLSCELRNEPDDVVLFVKIGRVSSVVGLAGIARTLATRASHRIAPFFTESTRRSSAGHPAGPHCFHPEMTLDSVFFL